MTLIRKPPAPPRSIRLKTPAKINWSLDILGKRPDGYHEIDTLLQAISLYDYLTITEIDEPRCRIHCDDPSIPTDKTNLIAQAWSLLRKGREDQVKGIRVDLEKNIPSGAGLGGGSSDAAAALYGIATLFLPGIKRRNMKIMAGRIGSDVPFFLWGGVALAWGRGELVDRIASRLPTTDLVVCYPGFPSPTAEAYAHIKTRPFEETKRPDMNATLLAAEGVEDGDVERVRRFGINIFDHVLTRRDRRYGKLKRLMEKCGVAAPILSGSGSACYGLADNRRAALEARDRLATTYPQSFAVRTIKCGPVILSNSSKGRG